MKSKTIILLFILVYASAFVIAPYDTYECWCYDNGLSGIGSTLEIRMENCGRACGGLTYCPTLEYMDCVTCCDVYCSFSGLEEGIPLDSCIDSCHKTCYSKNMLVEIYEAIKYIIIFIAAMMFAVCAIWFILSDKPESRDKAKGCMIYAIIGLIVVGLAIPLVQLIYEITLPTDVGPGYSCASLIGDAIISCYDAGMNGVSVFIYPCRNVDVSNCVGSATRDDVIDYIDSKGRKDITGTLTASASKIIWSAGTITSDMGSVCLKDHGTFEGDPMATNYGVEVEVLPTSSDKDCRSKQQIDMLGYRVKDCWQIGESMGGADDVFCPPLIAESELSSWPADVGVTVTSVYNYLRFNGEEDVSVDFKSGEVGSGFGDSACIYYDTSFVNEVFVLKSSEEPICSAQGLGPEVELIAKAARDCWDSQYGADTVCPKIDISGWDASVSVTQQNVEDYLEQILGRDDVADKLDFKSGSLSSSWGSDLVCIKYDTTMVDEVFVSKTSDDGLCSTADIGGKILTVAQNELHMDGSDLGYIKLNVLFENDDTIDGEYRLYLYSKEGVELDEEPDFSWSNLFAGAQDTIELTGVFSANTGGYYIRLKEENGEVIKDTYTHDFTGASSQVVIDMAYQIMNCWDTSYTSTVDVPCAEVDTASWEEGLMFDEVDLKKYFIACTTCGDPAGPQDDWNNIFEVIPVGDYLKKDYSKIEIVYDSTLKEVHVFGS
ncbi:MAG: hypothetical protein B6U97_02000 [Candidatus Altiarchaeales archaeon ex4484_96]|nr:MAG: hypothetical protein B6U97_02000 [Candidatus Altiarchaeales archaeon ex4484_96]